jgi:hypothetical protein
MQGALGRNANIELAGAYVLSGHDGGPSLSRCGQGRPGGRTPFRPADSDLPFRVAPADLNCVRCQRAEKKGATEAATHPGVRRRQPRRKRQARAS